MEAFLKRYSYIIVAMNILLTLVIGSQYVLLANKFNSLNHTLKVTRDVSQTNSPRYFPDKITTVDGALYFAGDGPMIQLQAKKDTDKPIIEWIDKNNNKIAWLVAHYNLLKDNEIKKHQHISIETVKGDYKNVVSRLTVTYGEDFADIAYPNANVLFNKNLYIKDNNGKYWLLTVSDGQLRLVDQSPK